ncbi:MAG: hypothetical protein ABTS16_20835 [Candidatus Accumulibacter phosphatis]|jgi:hypothetical protein|uniref:Transposase n=1 Tax=Candidatus Accumulibacter contiguus TaxID=2954381 RepID=A0ABX1T485_9PROT|nr:hypothetical protein [Candidatus Accumulibacter contiguus]NMQ03796.1 hypothetical protein [Candidatus Accumulibacter contiguus]
MPPLHKLLADFPSNHPDDGRREQTLPERIAELEAENAHLRAALEQIAGFPHAPDAWIVARSALQPLKEKPER